MNEATDIAQRAAWLQEHTETVRRTRDEAAALEGRASGLRLLAFVAIAAPWLFLSGQPLVALGLSVILVVGFVISVRRHLRLRARREQLDRQVLVCEESGRRIGGQVHLVRDYATPEADPTLEALLPRILPDGESWELTAQETGDLDLFSPPVGCFGLLNRTSTQIGAARLAEVVTHPLLDPEPIRQRYASVAWLSENAAPRIRLLGACAGLRDEDRRLARLLKAIAGAERLQTDLPVNAIRIWSLLAGLTCLVALALAFAGNASWGALLGGLITVNGLLYMQMQGAISTALEPWRDVGWAARGLEEATEAAAEELPTDGELGRLGDACRQAVDGLPLNRLRGRIGWSESGGMVNLLFNLLCLVDLHVASAILHVAVARKQDLLAAAAAVVELEVRLSLACLHAEQPLRCEAQPVSETTLEIDTGVHPLVEPEFVIANDVRLDQDLRFWVITGSNMAGKSTLLRMVALNVLLAQVAGFALARAMRWRPVRLMTDLRANDNLSRNESYFLAEVRHLRRMVRPPEDRTPLLGLIDEPFRGTNSEDQTAASVAVVRHLLGSGNLFLLATHDRHLTELADGREIRNFHFRENLGKDGMVFDYRLHDGPATTRNALRILEREGYPPELMQTAHRWHEEEGAREPGNREARTESR